MQADHKLSRSAWRLSVVAAATLAVVPLALPRIRSAATSRSDLRTDTLVASIRAEPRSFNRYKDRDLSTTVLTYLMHGALVRVNRVTNELEPELAERWERLADGRTYRLSLRSNVRFSDGAPFSADDVEFSFRAIYDRRVESILADSLEVSGQPLTVKAENATTVIVRFPAPFGGGLRILDGVPIYPRHRLEAALNAGAFRSAWELSTPPTEIAGLGPFTLSHYQPGQRLTLVRNPYYWRHDAGFPKLARVVLEVVPDQDAELLALETGAIDMTQSELRPFDVPELKHATSAGRVSLTDAGIGLDGDLFWVNLTSAKRRDPRSRWLQHPDFRRAVAHAIDRRVFVNTVFFGAAVPADGIISPGNPQWKTDASFPTSDFGEARRLLASLGLSASKDSPRFTLLTQKGNTSLERGAAVIRDSLGQLGVHVDVVTLEVGALIEYIRRGDYDAAYFRLLTTDSDPTLNLDFWLSSGSAHVWNPEQRAPSTDWESSIDRLMEQVSTTSDAERRYQAFEEVQRIVAREVPVLCFAFPRLPVAISARVIGASPAPFHPPVLWNPDGLSLQGAR